MTPDQIKEILASHALWLSGHGGKRAYLLNANLRGVDLRGVDLRGVDLRDADLQGASLRGVDLRDADLQGASLQGAIGNMREVKSAQFDTWPIAWTCRPDGATTLQIGCQKHDLELWRKSDPRWIAAMDEDAADWWQKYRDAVISLVDASPATPYGTSTGGTAT